MLSQLLVVRPDHHPLALPLVQWQQPGFLVELLVLVGVRRAVEALPDPED